MFVSCTDEQCGWSHDDFWDASYNPFRFMVNYEEELLNFEKLDTEMGWEAVHLGYATEGMTHREYLASKLTKAAQGILNQVFLTPEVAQESGVCPKCGKPLNWD